MSANLLDDLRILVDLPTLEEREARIFQQPRLLAPRNEQLMQSLLASTNAAERQKLAAIAQELDGLREALEQRNRPYPIGPGPIEQLWLRQANGEISAQYAATLARGADITASLVPIYVHGLSAACLEAAHQAAWRSALPIQELLLAALDALPAQPSPASPEAVTPLQSTLLDYAEIVQIALCELADGRLYHAAYRRAEEAITLAKAAQQNRFLGEMLHRLGTLHLDPYTAAYTSANYDQQLFAWRQRFIDEAGMEIASLPDAEWRMPEAQEALTLAADYLRAALPLRQGRLQGLSIKALIQALEWQTVTGLPAAHDEIIRLAHEALPLLEAPRDVQHRLFILAALSRQHEPVDLTEIDRIFALSLDEYTHQFGVRRTLDIVNQAASLLSDAAPRRSMELLHEARALFAREPDERLRINAWHTMLNLLVKMAPAFPATLPEGGIEALRQQLRMRAQQEGWDVRKQSEVLIALAARSGNWNEELAGLSILQEARACAPLFTQEYDEPLEYLRAILTLDEGVNAFGRADFGAAIDAYGNAMQQYLRMGLKQAIFQCLGRIDDLAGKVDPHGALQIILRIGPIAPALETTLGQVATDWLQRICKVTVATISNNALNPTALLFLWQIAKGMRFATALSAGIQQRRARDPEMRALLEQISAVEATIASTSGQDSEGDAPALLSKELLLAAYVRPQPGHAGDTDQERLANLQHRFDASLDQALVAQATDSDILYVTAEDIQAALDERTVLLNYYLGAAPNGNVGVYLVALTRESVRVTLIAHPFPSSQIIMEDGDQQIQINPLALIVESVRQHVQEYPGPAPATATQEARDLLDQYQRGFLGPFVEYLTELRGAGKDHLCILPHGPLHYFPFHLLGEANKPLAASWIVTYLPNLNLLLSRRGHAALRRHRDQTLTSIGLALEHNALGLPPLPQSLSEAKSVAALFGVQPLPEQQATPTNVLAALQATRYAHLSTHGLHNVDAPAFQCLYLTPENHSDGRLFAYEVLGSDLRGLELLTLSACETALGGFDTADNLRGLPASFLLAGVSTLVGTLWPVEANASERFFVTLYRELKAGAAKLNAFATAQRETRQAFPKYQDWGPFYMMGDWE
jgi:CHAT domain-containing protein